MIRTMTALCGVFCRFRARVTPFLLLLFLSTATYAGSNAVIHVNQLATGGDGSREKPWVGWETPINNLAGLGDGTVQISGVKYKISAMNALVYFPAGYYTQTKTLVLSSPAALKRTWTLRGDGIQSTQIIAAPGFKGDAVQLAYPVNGSVGAYTRIEDLALVNNDATSPCAPNACAGIDVVGATYVSIQRVYIKGFRYGMILDQTELSDVEECIFHKNLSAGLWLVNGPDHTAGAAPSYTNRIGIRKCQINPTRQGIGLADDGGYAHVITDNNFNASAVHLRIAGAVAAQVSGNEFEGAAEHCILSTYLSLIQRKGVGQNINLNINANSFSAPLDRSAIHFENAFIVNLTGNFFSAARRSLSRLAAISGLANVHTVHAANNFLYPGSHNVVLFDANPVVGASVANTTYGEKGGIGLGTMNPDSDLHVVGNVTVNGHLTQGAASFKIDHPLDPGNKYLSHAFMESPDMKNFYDGVAALDANGEAWVELPEWFETLNGQFRYQLTCLGGFAPVFVAQKISQNRFKIAGGQPGLEVSWQVTGIRQDAFANMNRIPVEEEKPVERRGLFLHPEAHGQPMNKRIP